VIQEKLLGIGESIRVRIASMTSTRRQHLKMVEFIWQIVGLRSLQFKKSIGILMVTHSSPSSESLVFLQASKSTSLK